MRYRFWMLAWVLGVGCGDEAPDVAAVERALGLEATEDAAIWARILHLSVRDDRAWSDPANGREQVRRAWLRERCAQVGGLLGPLRVAFDGCPIAAGRQLSGAITVEFRTRVLPPRGLDSTWTFEFSTERGRLEGTAELSFDAGAEEARYLVRSVVSAPGRGVVASAEAAGTLGLADVDGELCARFDQYGAVLRASPDGPLFVSSSSRDLVLCSSARCPVAGRSTFAGGALQHVRYLGRSAATLELDGSPPVPFSPPCAAP